jgi:hypothetical protein
MTVGIAARSMEARWQREAHASAPFGNDVLRPIEFRALPVPPPGASGAYFGTSCAMTWRADRDMLHLRLKSVALCLDGSSLDIWAVLIHLVRKIPFGS